MKNIIMQKAYLNSVALACLLLCSPMARAEDIPMCVDADVACQENIAGKVLNNSEERVVEVAPNTETGADISDPVSSGDGFSISVDGEVVAGSGTLADTQRNADVGLAQADIQVKFDGLDVRPMLNVSTVPPKESYEEDEELEFNVTLNYGSWISRADIIISEYSGIFTGVVAEIPVDSSGQATWRIPDGMTSKLSYVLRVYDAEGRYDETQARVLTSYTPVENADGKEDGPQRAQAKGSAGLNEDNTALRNIPVQGGAVTVFGRGIDKESEVLAFGETIPVDPDGNFLIQRILPPGDHVVDVEVQDSQQNNLDFSRQINIPSDDWFYVGLADLTVGKRFGDSDMKAVYPGEYDKLYSKGRLAFYIKGKIKGSTILTAALDTGEDKVQNLLKNMDDKDPRRFLKRIDPDDYYPIYGDDSATIEDAPTSGRFYVRLQRDDSHVMWGNFKTYVKGNKFLRNERALYGAQAVYKSNHVAPDAGRRTEISAYAAEPGTMTQNDILRGTGGSAYFTKQQDVTQGSESVSIELRDPVTGFVVSKTSLKSGTDYEFDYSQGVILLTEPLQSSSAGKSVYLVTSYEYTPATTNVEGYAYGGRAQQWLGDHVRVGATAMRDYSGDANLSLGGADVLLHATQKTYLDLHMARSKGNGFGFSTSSDGGLTYSNVAATTAPKKAANAYGFEAKVDLEDVTDGSVKGDLQAQYSLQHGGFSTLDSEISAKKEDLRLAGKAEVSEKTSLGLEFTQSKSAGKTDREAKGFVTRKLTEKTSLEISVKNTQKSGTIAAGGERGQRTDLGAKLSHDIDEDTEVFVFGQVTAHRNSMRKRDDRFGVGGKTDLSEKVSLEGEASLGTYGPGAAAKLNFSPTADSKYYIGYALDPYRDLDPNSNFLSSGTDLGAVIVGARQRLNEQLSLFAEDSYDMFGLKRTLAQTYGVDYAPHEDWSIGASFELGHIYDDTINSGTGLKNSDFDRKAGSMSVAYRNPNGNLGRVKGEVRFEDSADNTRDMDSYLMEATVELKANEDWRFLGNVDAVFSDASVTARDGEYVEGSLGFAYRPTKNDRLNALLKYTYLYDLPGADQVTVDGTLNGNQQQSHIFSADAIYDLNEIVSIGGKYGARIGETRNRVGSNNWSESIAHLGVIRADIHVISEWDLLLEGRLLWSPTADSQQLGALAAVYRHLGENFKVGVGYNFGEFSDDLRDLVADDHGVFVNAVGKF